MIILKGKHIGLTLATAVSLWLAGQTGLLHAEEMETGAVTVTATRTDKDLREVPVSVGVVSAEDLKKEPQTNVADMLSSVPGVTVTDGSMPGGKRVSIRGESPARSLILIDGVKVSEQKSMNGSAILIDTSQIERVEVIKGPASVLYGSEALGGVINIITKKGGQKPVSFSQNFVLDSSNNSLEVQSAVFGNYKGFNYRFSVSVLNAGDLRAANDTIENTSFSNRYYSGRLGYDWEQGSFYLRADRYESDIEIPVNTKSGVIKKGANAGMRNVTDVTLRLPKWDRETFTSGLELKNLTDNFTKLKLDLFSQNMKKDFYNNIHVFNWTDPIPPFNKHMQVTVDQNIRTYNDQDSLGGNFQTEWLLGNHYVIAGLDYNKDELKAKDYRLAGYTLVEPPMGAPILRPANEAVYHYKAEQSTTGLFLQDEWSFHDDFALTLGLRQTWVDSSLKENDNPDLPEHGDTKDSKMVGSVGGVYSGFDNLALRAMWSQGYRFPAVSQLYIGTVHGQAGRTLPNPELKPETSNNYELGARFNNDDWNLDVAIFYNDARNFITTQKVGASSDSQFVNMNKANTYGLELGLDYTFNKYGLTPYTTTTLMRRQHTNTITNFYNERITYKTHETGVPDFQGRVGLKWQKELEPSQTVFTDLYMNWATSSKEYRYDGTYAYDFVTDHNEAWQTLNLTLGTQWGEEHKWNASLSLKNIGNQAYIQADNTVPDPGFHVVVGVGFEY